MNFHSQSLNTTLFASKRVVAPFGERCIAGILNLVGTVLCSVHLERLEIHKYSSVDYFYNNSERIRMILFGFLFAMALFFVIGIASARKATKEVSDYLVAGRSISPVAAGLSAAASNNSGFMFIGAIGFTYSYGMSALVVCLDSRGLSILAICSSTSSCAVRAKRGR